MERLKLAAARASSEALKLLGGANAPKNARYAGSRSNDLNPHRASGFEALAVGSGLPFRRVKLAYPLQLQAVVVPSLFRAGFGEGDASSKIGNYEYCRDLKVVST